MDKDLKFYRLCQYVYQKGGKLLEDPDFTAMENELKARGYELDERWERITDAEGIQLMYEFGVAANIIESKEIQYDSSEYLKIIPADDKIREELEQFKIDKNKSIPIVTENTMFTQFYNLFKDAGVAEVFVALKLDGWNITLFIVNGYIVYAHTRGKLGEAKEITSIMKCILGHIDGKFNIKKGYVIGELILLSQDLPYLREKYSKEFKTTRNSISSFINNKVIAKDLPLAHLVAFKLEVEDKVFESPLEMYSELQKNGFEIPKYEMVKCNLSEMANLVIEWGNQINHLPPSDGIVFQPNSYLIKNSLHQLPSVTGEYETGIYAVKMGAWGQQVYKSVVKEIQLTTNAKSKRPSLIVEPVTSRDGRSISVIPIDHIGRLVDEDIYVGKEISFSIVSEKDIRLVYDDFQAKLRLMV